MRHADITIAALAVAALTLASSVRGATPSLPPASPAAEDTRPAQVDAIMAPWDRLLTPGAAVAVVRDGRVVFAKGYGVAQLEYDIPITPKTVFHIASISKQFTAFSVVLLAARGELSLDDDIRVHIPEVPDLGHTITLRQLIHHTSGLRDQWDLLALAGWRLDDVITRDQIMTLVSNQRAVNFEPGTEYLYCNTGYTLLAETVARVSGQSFSDWTRENIFEPLGMEDTHFHDDHQLIVPNRAYSYAPRGSGYEKKVLSYANVGATSLFTTVQDMARWSHNFDTAAVGGLEVIEQMHEQGVLNDGTSLPYAFGLVVGEHEGMRQVSHGGSDAGFRSHFVRYPDEDLAIVVLSNLGSFNASDASRKIRDVYLDKTPTIEPAPNATTEAVTAADTPASAPTPTPATDPGALDDYVGDYLLELGFWVEITRDGEQLVGQVQGQPEVRLVPTAADTFTVREVGAKLVFSRDDAGRVTALTLHQGPRAVKGERGTREAPSAEMLAEYTGRYDSVELGTFYEVVVVDGALMARHRRHGDIALNPRTADTYVGNRWFFGKTTFERDDDGAVTAMLVSSGRVRAVRFDRAR